MVNTILARIIWFYPAILHIEEPHRPEDEQLTPPGVKPGFVLLYSLTVEGILMTDNSKITHGSPLSTPDGKNWPSKNVYLHYPPKEAEHPQLSSSLMGIARIRTSQASTNAASREDLEGRVFGN